MKQDYDILIVGAGIVGTSLALALSQLPLRIALIEQSSFKTLNTSKLLDVSTFSIFINLETLKLLGIFETEVSPKEVLKADLKSCFNPEVPTTYTTSKTPTLVVPEIVITPGEIDPEIFKANFVGAILKF